MSFHLLFYLFVLFVFFLSGTGRAFIYFLLISYFICFILILSFLVDAVCDVVVFDT